MEEGEVQGPPGWAVMAVLIGSELYCLGCREEWEGVSLQEADIWYLQEELGAVVCCGCGAVL